MAHGDYSCCAMCDCKMSYGEEATKESFCQGCLCSIADSGINAVTPDRFLEWAKTQHRATLAAALLVNGYHRCWYRNSFDSAIQEMLGVNFEQYKETEGLKQIVESILPVETEEDPPK